MKVCAKLNGAVGVLAVLGVLVAGSGVRYIQTLGEELTNATDKTAIKLDLINAARARSWEMVAALQGALSLCEHWQADGIRSLCDALAGRVQTRRRADS